MTTVQKTCHVRSSTRRRTPVLDFLSLAEQHRAFQRRALVDLDSSRGVFQKRPGPRVVERIHYVALLLSQPVDRPQVAQPAEPSARRLPEVVAVVTHSPAR